MHGPSEPVFKSLYMICDAIRKPNSVVDTKATIGTGKCSHYLSVMAHCTAKNVGPFTIDKISSYVLPFSDFMLVNNEPFPLLRIKSCFVCVFCKSMEGAEP
jgi:hypothetical protein